MRVGVIGLGRTGLPVARNLMARGFRVTGYRRSGCEELDAAGGLPAASAAEVAAHSDILLSILPDSGAVEDVVRGPAGTLTALRPGTVHIEMSAVDTNHKARIRDAVRAAGGDLLDCAVGGTPAMVTHRQATTFVSGDPATVESVRSVLDAISGRWVYTGAFGSGTGLRHVANLVLAMHSVAAAEALVLAAGLGLNLDLVRRTVDISFAESAVWRQRGPTTRVRHSSPELGPIAALHPLLEQIVDAAAAAGVYLPVFTAARATFDKAIAERHGQLDITALGDLLAAPRPAEDTMAADVSSNT